MFPPAKVNTIYFPKSKRKQLNVRNSFMLNTGLLGKYNSSKWEEGVQLLDNLNSYITITVLCYSLTSVDACRRRLKCMFLISDPHNDCFSVHSYILYLLSTSFVNTTVNLCLNVLNVLLCFCIEMFSLSSTIPKD